MHRSLFYALFLLLSPLCIEAHQGPMLPQTLRMRESHWQPQVAELYDNGTPKKVVLSDGEEAVKELLFYVEGMPKEEADLKKGTRDGVAVGYDREGHIIELSSYKNGVLEGEKKEYYPSGALQSEATYKNGKPLVKISTYYESGKKKSITPYKEGVPHGKAQTWYEGGELKQRALYQEGLLSSEGTMPAVMGYAPNQVVIEVQDFSKGIPLGVHIKYHESGAKKYQVNYVNGKKEGRESYFNEQGKVLGGGEYKEGVAKGVHLRHYPSGALKKRLVYQKEGGAKINSFYEDGDPKATYCQKGDLLVGAFVNYHPGKQVQSEGNYSEKGKKEGEWKSYHANGEVATLEHYENGLNEGVVKRYNPKGELTAEAFCVNGKPEGVLKLYYAGNRLRQLTHFEKGNREGEEINYHPNGKKKSVVHYKNNLLDGEFLKFYADGSIEAVMAYSNGRPIGEHRDFYPKKHPDAPNVLRRLAYFDEMGRHEGEQRSYAEDGTLILAASYKKGVLDGPFFQQTPQSDQIISHYKEGLQVGRHELYFAPDKSGKRQLRLEATFEAGLPVGEMKEYNASGALIAQTSYVKGKKQGEGLFFGIKGELLMRIPFVDDKQEGVAITYYPNGKLYQETFFKNGLKEGAEKTYFEDGSLLSIYNYSADQLDGLCQEWNPEGLIVFEGEYKEGAKHGKFNKYYEDGRPRLMQTFESGELCSKERF